MKIPKEKRRGGQRDDSTLTVGLNKKELVELLERTRRRCEEYERKQEELILKRSGILIVKSNIFNDKLLFVLPNLNNIRPDDANIT